MNRKQCKELLELTGDKCPHCKIGRYEIACENFIGAKCYYLQCNNCEDYFDGP